MFDLVCPNFYRNIHTGLQYGFFSSKSEQFRRMSILRKIFCNMHIAIESILRLIYVRVVAWTCPTYVEGTFVRGVYGPLFARATFYTLEVG